jgi:hypothetical protein
VIIGDTDILVRYLERADGFALNYTTKALFLAAGFDLTWKDSTGTALVAQPDWDLVASSGSRHQFEYVIPEGIYTVETTVPLTHVSSPKETKGEGQFYDNSAIGSLIASAASVSISPTSNSSSATMYDGDSIYIAGISIPEAALTAIGATSLADCASRLAFIKRSSQDSNDEPDVDAADGLSVTATSDSSGNRVMKIECTAFPAVLGVLDDTTSLAAKVNVRLAKSSKEIVAAVVDLTVLWVAPQGEATP